MAWISVHENIFGSKLRSTAKVLGCSQNEVVGILVRLWLWGIRNATADGKLVGADKDDVAEVLTVGKDDSLTAESIVEGLIQTKWMEFDDDALYFHDWEEWQSIWYKYLDRRAKDAQRKRNERTRKKNAGNAEVAKTKDKVGYTAEFEEFWTCYPRKVDKGSAYAKYKARLNDGWTDNQLKVAAKNYASSVIKNKTESKFIKHASTFLSDKTPFVDYLPTELKLEDKEEDNPFEEWR